jgi:hypothetical protein
MPTREDLALDPLLRELVPLRHHQRRAFAVDEPGYAARIGARLIAVVGLIESLAHDTRKP